MKRETRKDTLPRTDLVLSFTNHFVAFNYRNLEPRP